MVGGMRLYGGSTRGLCLWCGASVNECLDAPFESTALKCCPDCDHGKPVTMVPWCAEHDSPMMGAGEHLACQRAFYRDPELGRCRLEVPPQHYVIGET